MLKTICNAAALILMLSGLFLILYLIFEKLLTRKSKRHFLAVVPGFEDDENLPEEVYAAFAQCNLFGFVNRHEVVVIDYGISQSIKNSCRHLLGDEQNIVFCTPEDFSNIMERFG